MNLALGCIADDYTGASDLANTLTAEGLRTVQTIGVPPDDLPLADADAVVIALKSRSIAPDAAVALSEAALAWLLARGADHVMFKICSTFDSTDRGNIGPVTDALRGRLECGPVLVTPAFPATGRSVFMGHLFVGRTLLSDSPLRDHPLNPMHDPDLVRVLRRQSAHGVGLIERATVARGADAVREAIGRAPPECGALIADAIDESDLVTLGAVARDARLSVGASGLGLGLGRAIAAAPGAAAPGAAAPGATVRTAAPAGTHGTPPGRCAILAGSCSAATLGQLEAIEGVYDLLRLNVDRVVENGAGAVASAIAWAAARPERRPFVIASSTSAAAREARPTAQTTGAAATGGTRARDDVAARIEAAFATIGRGLAEAGLDRLIVAGGETSGAVVDALGIEAFRIGSELAPGVPLMTAIGRRHAGLSMALKSGNFGGREFFRLAAEHP